MRFAGSTGCAVGLLWSLGTVLLALVFFLFRNRIAPGAQGISGLLLILGTLVTCASYRWAPPYLFRAALLAAPPTVSGAVLLAFPDAYIAFHGQQFQTTRIAGALLLLTAMALGASGLAWGVGTLRKVRIAVGRGPRAFHLRYACYAMLAVVAGTANAHALGPLVWNAGYSTMTNEAFLGLGIYPVAAIFGLLGLATLLQFEPRATRAHRALFWVIAVYVLLLCMWFRGMRLEVCAAAAAMYLLRLDLRPVRVPVIKVALLGVTLFLAAQSWGVYRQFAESGVGLGEAASMAVTALREGNTAAGVVTYQFGTASDIAATMFSTYGLIESGRMPFQYGDTYLEFIPRTLPRVILPDRPKGMEWIFGDYGVTSGGGIFELSEAYANFGVAGMILVPGLITYLLCRVYRRALIDRTHLTVYAYAAALTVFPRGIWYQTFSFYKSAILWLLIEGGILMLATLTARLAEPVGPGQPPLPGPEIPPAGGLAPGGG